MKKSLPKALSVLLLLSHFSLIYAYSGNWGRRHPSKISAKEMMTSDLKKAAFAILDTKCNECHRKKNPFKVFSLKNMDRNATKIHKQVFVYKRMPKGGEIKLTEEEYTLLEQWIKSTIK